MSLRRSCGGVLLLSLVAWVGAARADETAIYYDSEPGDYIGQGQEEYLTPQDGEFQLTNTFGGGVQLYFNNFNQSVPVEYIWWSLNIAGASGQEVQLGTYENARRWPFNDDHPGLDFSGSGRGCNQLSGRFEVKELVRDPLGAVTKLAVNFEQYCEMGTARLVGQVRYNSSIPIDKQKPVKISITNPRNSGGCVEATGPAGTTITTTLGDVRDKLGGVSLNYLWSTDTGVTAKTKDFTFPLGIDPTGTEVRVKVTDLTDGSIRVSSRPVCVVDTTPPQIVILSPKPGQLINRDDLPLIVKITDITDKTIQKYTVSVGSVGEIRLDPRTGVSNIRFPSTNQALAPARVSVRVDAQDRYGNGGSAFVDVLQGKK